MNKEMAIKILENEKSYMQQHAGRAQIEAFDMAIEALQRSAISKKEIRDKAIEEALEKSAKAICIGCGYLDGFKCTYKGANCSVSKPMLESVTKALEQMKEVGE